MFNCIVLMESRLHLHALQREISKQVSSTDLQGPTFLKLAGSGICSGSIIGLGRVFINDDDHRSMGLWFLQCPERLSKSGPLRRQTGAKSDPNLVIRDAEVKLIRLSADVMIDDHQWRQAWKPALPRARTVRRSSETC